VAVNAGAATVTSLFEPVLADLSERHRDEILAAFAAVENSPEPVPEAVAPALHDATLRRSVEEMLNLIGRTLVRAVPGRWTSGYRDDIAARLTGPQQTGPQQIGGGQHALPVTDRAVLTLVLIHSVAIPRTEGTLAGDAWVDGTPTPVEELQRRTQLPRGELRQSLGRLRAAGLVRVVPARLRPGNGAHGTAYLPGPQFHRLTEAARRRLQEELILAAGPDTPLAAAIRRRRSHENSTHEKEHS
jgi:DNA-binding transcriptional ArsR family regulator